MIWCFSFTYGAEAKTAWRSFPLTFHLTFSTGGSSRVTETSDRPTPLILTVMASEHAMRTIRFCWWRLRFTSNANARHGAMGCDRSSSRERARMQERSYNMRIQIGIWCVRSCCASPGTLEIPEIDTRSLLCSASKFFRSSRPITANLGVYMDRWVIVGKGWKHTENV